MNDPIRLSWCLKQAFTTSTPESSQRGLNECCLAKTFWRNHPFKASEIGLQGSDVPKDVATPRVGHAGFCTLDVIASWRWLWERSWGAYHRDTWRFHGTFLIVPGWIQVDMTWCRWRLVSLKEYLATSVSDQFLVQMFIWKGRKHWLFSESVVVYGTSHVCCRKV